LAFALWAYVFMPDHAHLMIYPQQASHDMRPILKAIKEPVGRKAVAFLRQEQSPWLHKIAVQRRHKVTYHFWQRGGGYDRNVTEAEALAAMIDYIHNNPVRAGLVATAADWRWSSAAWFEGKEPNTLRPDSIPVEWLIARK
jgi:putative transposase